MKWCLESGEVISCVEKLKILEENLEELASLKLSFEELQETQEFKDALEDAVLFGISPIYFKEKIENYLYNYTLEK